MTIVVGVAWILNFSKVAAPIVSSLSARNRTKALSRKGWNLLLA
jgi:hypothetical protein